MLPPKERQELQRFKVFIKTHPGLAQKYATKYLEDYLTLRTELETLLSISGMLSARVNFLVDRIHFPQEKSPSRSEPGVRATTHARQTFRRKVD